MNISNEALISATKAAMRLGVSPRSVQRHFPTIRIGGRILVRVSDVEAKIAAGQRDVVNLLAFMRAAEDVTFRLRQDYEKGGEIGHHWLIVSSIVGYLTEHTGHPLFPVDEPVNGLASHFVQWLKQHPPQGGGDEGEELRNWISDYLA